MKLIVAIIRPEKLEDVQRALAERDVYLMTVSEVRGCGRQRGYTEVYRGAEVNVRLLAKLKLEIAVNEPFVEAAVEAIVHAARTGDTGAVGDGKIFVMPMDDCVR
ncbi:MAG TPA: P-II family nitrogen regulator, partial [Urbifossiella sp.]|nr:P-II family nitrogen regulator [Urbifossiella sp.]